MTKLEETTELLKRELEDIGIREEAPEVKLIESHHRSGIIVYEARHRIREKGSRWKKTYIECFVGDENGFLRSGKDEWQSPMNCLTGAYTMDNLIVVRRTYAYWALNCSDLDKALIFDREKFVPYGTRDGTQFSERLDNHGLPAWAHRLEYALSRAENPFEMSS